MRTGPACSLSCGSGPSSAEFAGVVELVQKRLGAGVPPEEIAILVRSSANRFRAELVGRFEDVGVLVTNSDWVRSALQEREMRRLLALARLVAAPDDSLAWMGLLHQTAGIGKGTLMKLYNHACESRATFGAMVQAGRATGFTTLGGPRARVREAVDEIFGTLGELTGEHEGAELDHRGWGGWLLDRATPDSLSEDATRVLTEVGALAMATGSDHDAGLGGFVNQLQPLAMDLATEEEGAVRLMSMAQSKGLTVNTAILMAVDDDTIPLPSGDEDEERRILYVAMTRATDCCIITTATRRTGATARIGSAGALKRTRTRFLRGLPPSVPPPVDGPSFIAGL